MAHATAERPDGARPSVELDQVPRMVRRSDDALGLAWRVTNRLRRVSLRRFGRFSAAYANPPRFTRPVFIIGAPRSGTTMLFHLLRESSVLGALPHEGHDVWRMYHHPRLNGWRSDAAGADDVRWGESRWVRACFGVHTRLPRFVEKTPENCLRIPYLLRLFPDACFVVLRRNPCDVINSLINGWRHPEGRFRSYYVPEDLDIPGYPAKRRWCFALIDGWRDLRKATIPEIAFAQWEQCVRGIDAARGLVKPGNWVELSFEELISRPSEALEPVYAAIGIYDEPALREKLRALLARPVNALSAPGSDKWRRDNPAEIAALLPRIAALGAMAGYHLDPLTGTVETKRWEPSEPSLPLPQNL
jgi:hypothetical protein